ncbi:MAG: ribosomal protein S18-alanine N-acetyltransferase [Myxococcota bacterium]|nr:ribosomal protein S18-alanine N-acetyltransferase [Myxococcota bacterium]
MVTPITPTDFGATAGLLRSEMRGGGHTTVDALRADHTRPHWVGLVQRTDEGVVGALIGQCVLDEAEIHEVAVHAAHRRKGVATLLLDAFLHEVRRRGATICRLEVRRTNASAMAFYRQHGFKQSGLRTAYYADGEDALLLQKPLEPIS